MDAHSRAGAAEADSSRCVADTVAAPSGEGARGPIHLYRGVGVVWYA